MSNVQLSRAKLAWADLRDIRLSNADLSDVDLTLANLSSVDLRDAILKRATLTGAIMGGANLAGADFEDADLRSTVFDSKEGHFADCRLAGANLDGAQDTGKYFECEARIKTVSAMADSYTKTLAAMFTALAYAAITVLGMTDDRLIPNSSLTQLPLLSVQVPAGMFFVVAPLVLLVFFTYVQTLYTSLDAAVKELPAVLPNGSRPEAAFSPWLMRPQTKQQGKWRGGGGASQAMIGTRVTAVLARWAAVLCIAIFWFRYLSVHDFAVSIYHLVLIAVTAALAEFDSGKPMASLYRSRRGKLGYAALLLALLVAAAFSGGVCLGRIDWAAVNANFSHREVSARPTSMTGAATGFSHRIDMVGLNLQHAVADGSSIAGADLDKANLYGANFTRADLSGARFPKATLSGVQFNGARMIGADLEGVDTFGGDFSGADLSGANLKGVDFAGRPVAGAIFRSAILKSAQFDSTNNLSGADFTCAELGSATFNGTDLSNAVFRNARLKPATFQAGKDTLTGIDFSNADLRSVTFIGKSGVNLNGVNFCGAILDGADLRNTDLSGTTGLTPEQLSVAKTTGAVLPDHANRLGDLPKANCPVQVEKCGK